MSERARSPRSACALGPLYRKDTPRVIVGYPRRATNETLSPMWIRAPMATRRENAEVRRRRAPRAVAGTAAVEEALVDEGAAFPEDADPSRDEDVPLRDRREHEVVRAAVMAVVAIVVVQEVGAEPDGEVVGDLPQMAGDQRNRRAAGPRRAGRAVDVLGAEREVRLDLESDRGETRRAGSAPRRPPSRDSPRRERRPRGLRRDHDEKNVQERLSSEEGLQRAGQRTRPVGASAEQSGCPRRTSHLASRHRASCHPIRSCCGSPTTQSPAIDARSPAGGTPRACVAGPSVSRKEPPLCPSSPGSSSASLQGSSPAGS